MKTSLIVLSAIIASALGASASAKTPNDSGPPPQVDDGKKAANTTTTDVTRVGQANPSTRDRGPKTDPRVHTTTGPNLTSPWGQKSETPKPTATPTPQKQEQKTAPQPKSIPNRAEVTRGEHTGGGSSGGSVDGHPTEGSRDHFDKMTHTG